MSTSHPKKVTELVVVHKQSLNPSLESSGEPKQCESFNLSNSKPVTCYKCRKKGHFAATCPEKHELNITSIESKLSSTNSSSEVVNHALENSSSCMMHLVLSKNGDSGHTMEHVNDKAEGTTSTWSLTIDQTEKVTRCNDKPSNSEITTCFPANKDSGDVTNTILNKECEAVTNLIVSKEEPPGSLQEVQAPSRESPKEATTSELEEFTLGEPVRVHNRLSRADDNIVNKEKPPDAPPPIKTRGNYLDSQKRMRANLLSLGAECTTVSSKPFQDKETTLVPSSVHECCFDKLKLYANQGQDYTMESSKLSRSAEASLVSSVTHEFYFDKLGLNGKQEQSKTDNLFGMVGKVKDAEYFDPKLFVSLDKLFCVSNLAPVPPSELNEFLQEVSLRKEPGKLQLDHSYHHNVILFYDGVIHARVKKKGEESDDKFLKEYQADASANYFAYNGQKTLPLYEVVLNVKTKETQPVQALSISDQPGLKARDHREQLPEDIELQGKLRIEETILCLHQDASQSHIWRPGDYLGRSRHVPHKSWITSVHMFPKEPQMDLSSFCSFRTYQWRPGDLSLCKLTYRENKLVTNHALIQEEPPDPTPLPSTELVTRTEHNKELIQVSISLSRFVSHDLKAVSMSLLSPEIIEKNLDLIKKHLKPFFCRKIKVKEKSGKYSALMKSETCLLVYCDSMTVIICLVFAKSVESFAGTKEEPPDLEVLSIHVFVRIGIGVVLMKDKKPLDYFRMIFEVGERVWTPSIAGPIHLTRRIINNAYQLHLQGKHSMILLFDGSNLVLFVAGKTLDYHLHRFCKDQTFELRRRNSTDEASTYSLYVKNWNRIKDWKYWRLRRLISYNEGTRNSLYLSPPAESFMDHHDHLNPFFNTFALLHLLLIFSLSNLRSFLLGQTDLRTNPFQQGELDANLRSSKDQEHGVGNIEDVESSWKQKEAKGASGVIMEVKTCSRTSQFHQGFRVSLHLVTTQEDHLDPGSCIKSTLVMMQVQEGYELGHMIHSHSFSLSSVLSQWVFRVRFLMRLVAHMFIYAIL